MEKKLIILLAFLVIIFLTVLISCKGEGERSSNSNIRVGVAIYRYDDNFISFMRRNIESLFAGKASVIMNDSQNNQATQNDQIDAIIQRDVDVLAINLVDPQAAPIIIDKVRSKDIPIIFFNKEPTKEAMMSYDKTWYVGTRSQDSGDMQGKIVANSWRSNPRWDKNRDGVIQFVLLKGEPGHPDAEARTSRVQEYLTNNGINIEKLEEQPAMWDVLEAQKIANAWIKKYGDKIEFIISNNDSMAIGALQAIEAQGYNSDDPNKFIPIVGVDAIPEMLEEIKKGTVIGTVLQSPLSQAKAVVDMSLNAALGKNPTDGTIWTLDELKAVRVPYVPITIDDISVAEEAYK